MKLYNSCSLCNSFIHIIIYGIFWKTLQWRHSDRHLTYFAYFAISDRNLPFCHTTWKYLFPYILIQPYIHYCVLNFKEILVQIIHPIIWHVFYIMCGCSSFSINDLGPIFTRILDLLTFQTAYYPRVMIQTCKISLE